MWGSEIFLWGNVGNRPEGKSVDRVQEAEEEAGVMVQQEEGKG